MKRRLYLIILLATVTLSGLAQNIGDAFYIYRNDGEFNAFFRNEVISIEYSYKDTEGNTYDEIITQIVNTVDSVYKIPLAAIDSVSFVQPKAIVNSNVFTMTADHSSYILKADTLSFVLSTSTPANLQPLEGNIVVSSYDCPSFPNGIMAKVISHTEQIDGIYYECERAAIDDVYDQIVYYGYGNVYDDRVDNWSRTRAEARTSGILWDDDVEEAVSYSGTSATFGNHVKGAFEIVLRKTLGNPIYARLTFSNDITSSIFISASSEVDIKPDPVQIGKKLRVGRIVIPEFPLIWFEPQLSLFGYFEEEGSVNIDFSAHSRRFDKFQLTCRNKAWTFNHTTPINEYSIDVASLSMKGSVEVGIQPEMMIALNGFPTGIGITTKVGLKESVDFKFDATKYFDNGIYESIKDSKTEESVTLFGSIFAQLGLFEGNCSRGDYTIVSREIPISTHYLLPTFSEISSEKAKDMNNAYIVSTSINRDLLLPVSVGFGLFDKDNELLQSKYSNQSYRLEKDWTLNGLTQIFENIRPGKIYACSPMIKLLGLELRATPSVELGEDMEVQTGDVKNIGHTSADAYGIIIADDLSSMLNNEYGICYVEKGKSDEWEYESSRNSDSNGNYFASLTGLKAETEYIYCAYIKIAEDEYNYGEEKTFITNKDDKPSDASLLCPDDNHPHWIDLGLPSGTKWKCCNEGASKPEDYGEYYTYKERSSAATAKQYEELVHNSSWSWSMLNGVNGYKFSGSNGGTIFLPAAGMIVDDKLIREGIDGCYFTSGNHSGKGFWEDWEEAERNGITFIWGFGFSSQVPPIMSLADYSESMDHRYARSIRSTK